MLTTYLRLIQEQRIENPKTPKDYRLLELPRLTTTSTEAIENLATRPNALFTNIIKRQIPRYRDTEDVYYYEFVNLGLKNRTAFPDWEYWYIPVSKYEEMVAITGTQKLPSYKLYDVQTNKVSEILTIEAPLIPFVRPNTTFFTTAFKNNLHPLCSNFVFTGYSFLNKKGFMIYEYQDYNMYHDDISITYYSVFRPLNFFIKSSIANNYGIEINTSILKFIGKPPGYLELYSGLPDLQATGRSTNSSFSNVRKWYEYTRFIDNQPYDKILLPYAPTSLSIDFVKVEINNSQMSVVFNQTDNIQTISIDQISSNKKITIQ